MRDHDVNGFIETKRRESRQSLFSINSEIARSSVMKILWQVFASSLGLLSILLFLLWKYICCCCCCCPNVRQFRQLYSNWHNQRDYFRNWFFARPTNRPPTHAHIRTLNNNNMVCLSLLALFTILLCLHLLNLHYQIIFTAM